MVESKKKVDTLAILVCYGQDFRQCSSWLSLRVAAGAQLDWFVADNSPHPVLQDEAIVYRHYPHNPGVSVAYLEGAAFARNEGYSWILLLDQDTNFPAESWQAYQEARTQWPDYALYSPQLWSAQKGISPAPARFGRAFASEKLPSGPYSLAAYSPINAGMLLSLDAYLAVGGHVPSVYLDFSDYAFIRKFRRKFPKAVALPLRIHHHLSGTEKRTKEQDFTRFGHYCRCAKAYARVGGPRFWLFFWAFARALLLGIRHRSFRFFGLILTS